MTDILEPIDFISSPDNPKGWATEIARQWRTSIEAIIQTGRLLKQAKAALPHGDFTAMIEAELPFAPRTAQRLMVIADDERLTNAAHVSLLPPSWATLYELARLSDEEFQDAFDHGVIRPELERNEILQHVKAIRRSEREKALAAQCCPLPSQKFGVIVADPEWRFEPYSRRSGMDRAADNHYLTSPLDVIASRDVGSIAADDCILFLWATVPMLPEAFCVLDGWGFARFERDESGLLKLDKRQGRYVSSGVWTKYHPGADVGMGHWFPRRPRDPSGCH